MTTRPLSPLTMLLSRVSHLYLHLVINHQDGKMRRLTNGPCTHLSRNGLTVFSTRRRSKRSILEVEGKLLWLGRNGTQGWKSRRSWRRQMIWRGKGNCKAKLHARWVWVSRPCTGGAKRRTSPIGRAAGTTELRNSSSKIHGCGDW